MINFETEQFRKILPYLNSDADFESHYTFYYDETNNIKKFHLKKGDFNVAFSSNFVLGGLAYRGTQPDIDDIFSKLTLQASTKEVKLKHLATGDFLECLNSKKLTPFLEYLVQSPLYLHFSTLNLLYFSVVDIVDSAITNSEDRRYYNPLLIRKLKNDLYKICRLEINRLVPLFVKYNYPNVDPTDIPQFITGILELLIPYESLIEYKAGVPILQDLLNDSLKKGELAFVMDNENLMLINGLLHFYMRPIYTFVNSVHVFDNEAEIIEEFKKYNITYKGKKLENFNFKDSTTDKYIQASDIIVGFVGKLSKYFNTHNQQEIINQLNGINEIQRINLNHYVDLVLKSEQHNPGLFHYTDSDDDHSKNRLMIKVIKGM